MKIYITILSVVVILACSYNDKAVMLSYGIVKNETVEIEVNNNLVAGELHLIDSWNLIKKTKDIPGHIGIEFGISYKIEAPPHLDSVTVDEVMIFPGEGLYNPKSGRRAKIESETVDINPREEQYFSYALDYPWEIKSGIWLFQVKQNNRVLLEKSFNVQ